MNINLLFEIILILFAILASNGIIYSLTFLNKPNSSENISVITNSLEKDGLALTSLIASNHIRLTSSESSTSQTLSVTSSESSSSQTLSVSSSETNVSENLSVSSSETNVSENIFDSENSYLSNTNEENLLSNVEMSDNFTSLDSLTILDTQSYEQ
jgi:outer membrane lipopolysaccharide assembly protein LptE/RlpB